MADTILQLLDGAGADFTAPAKLWRHGGGTLTATGTFVGATVIAEYSMDGEWIEIYSFTAAEGRDVPYLGRVKVRGRVDGGDGTTAVSLSLRA